MNTLVINGVTYKEPESVLKHNAKDEDGTYNTLFLKYTFIGREDWEEIDNRGGDWMNESECFAVYGNHYGVNGDEASLDDVGSAMYALYMNYDEDEYEIHLLEPVNK